MSEVIAHQRFDITMPKLTTFYSSGNISIGTDPDRATISFPYGSSYSFFGSGFDFKPFAGVNTWTGSVDRVEIGRPQLTVTDLHLDLAVIGDLFAAQDAPGFWRYLFHGDDHIEGSPKSDHFQGFAGNDVIHGGAGNDILEGGPGTDSLVGGLGNDVYYIDSVSEIARGTADPGIDTVYSKVSYELGPQQEHLHLTGTRALDGSGNALANELTGNAGANHLLGKGGNDVLDGRGGADQLAGGPGNDIYVIDRADEIRKGLADAGIDTVKSRVDYTLGPAQEHLVLLGDRDLDAGGNAGANHLTGNRGHNVLDGGNGNDTLRGLDGDDSLLGGAGNDILDGGSGIDHLNGGAGRDLFVLHDLPGGGGDVIVDFEGAGSSLGDLISLDRSLFDSLPTTGTLAAELFESGPGLQAATAPATRIVYDTTSGELRYDGDGLGGFNLILTFGTLQGAPAGLDASDFVVT